MDKHYAQQCFPILRTYLGYMENIKGHSEKTVDGYFVDLRTFFRFLKQYRGLADEQQPESEKPCPNISAWNKARSCCKA